MSQLFKEFNLKKLIIRNRIVMPPMCMWSADEFGNANDYHFVHYVSRAMGGVGLIIFEATAIESRGRISSHDIGLYRDEHIEGLKRITNEVKKYGAKVGVQLAHAGRKCEANNEENIAPSVIEDSRFRIPVAMTKLDIQDVIFAFRNAALRAYEADFDVIEIHAAHGYLINQFLSPLTNKRNDEYGGSLENRVRLLLEVIDAIKEVWPSEQPIIVRLSADEYHPDGNHINETVEVAKMLKNKGVDLINVSSGGVVKYPLQTYPGYQVEFSNVIKHQANIPTIAGGLITDAKMADDIIDKEKADLVFIGTELLRDPYWPLHASIELNAEFEWPVFNFAKPKLKSK
ncbi:MAG: namA [Haloplasmataceae bacterium]|nr:namA [Haloplasmataceae bacterium]